MRNLLLTSILALSTISGLMLGYLGLAWIYEGYGLNPLIAFPLALVITVFPTLIAEKLTQ